MKRTDNGKTFPTDSRNRILEDDFLCTKTLSCNKQNMSNPLDEMKIHVDKQYFTNSDLNESAFSPAMVTSTPIKSGMVGGHMSVVANLDAEYAVKSELLQRTHKARYTNNEFISDNNLQETNGSKCNERNDEFVPIAIINNIITNIKGEDNEVKGMCTQRIFEVPNTMIAYVYDEATQTLNQMEIIQLNDDVSTYQLINPKDNEKLHVPDKIRGDPKYLQDIPYSKKSNGYRLTAFKWKKIRHMVPRRPPKPKCHRNIGMRKAKSERLYDEDYKPPSHVKLSQGIIY